MTRICNKCGKELPATKEYFHIMGGWMNTHCKDCHKQYYYARKDEILARQKIHREGIRAERAEYNKRYYADKKESVAAYNKEYRAKHREELYAQQKIWRANHKESRAAEGKRYRAKNKVKLAILSQKRRARKRELPSTLTKEQWENIKIIFAHRCCYCGGQKPLEQEHFIPLSNGGEYTTNNIIPACRDCNLSKSDSSFFDWYPRQRFYSKERERRILKFLNYKGEAQQLSIFIA